MNSLFVLQNGPPFLTWLGLPSHHLVEAMTIPLLLTMLLFLGPLVIWFYSEINIKHSFYDMWVAQKWISIRNLIAVIIQIEQ